MTDAVALAAVLLSTESPAGEEGGRAVNDARMSAPTALENGLQ